MNKLKVACLFGGKSSEYKISLVSASAVIKNNLGLIVKDYFRPPQTQKVLRDEFEKSNIDYKDKVKDLVAIHNRISLKRAMEENGFRVNPAETFHFTPTALDKYGGFGADFRVTPEIPEGYKEAFKIVR